MNHEIGRERELRSLVELCRSLAELGMGVQIRDAVPALTVTQHPMLTDRVAAHVTLDPSGSRFTWWCRDNSHPVTDVEGTALRVAEFLRRQTQPLDEP